MGRVWPSNGSSCICILCQNLKNLSNETSVTADDMCETFSFPRSTCIPARCNCGHNLGTTTLPWQCQVACALSRHYEAVVANPWSQANNSWLILSASSVGTRSPTWATVLVHENSQLICTPANCQVPILSWVGIRWRFTTERKKTWTPNLSIESPECIPLSHQNTHTPTHTHTHTHARTNTHTHTNDHCNPFVHVCWG